MMSTISTAHRWSVTPCLRHFRLWRQRTSLSKARWDEVGIESCRIQSTKHASVRHRSIGVGQISLDSKFNGFHELEKRYDPHIFASLHQEPMAIGSGEVHVWWLQTDSMLSVPGILEACAGLLDEDEISECLNTKDPVSRDTRIVARAFTRSVLARYLADEAFPHDGPAPKSLEFVRNAHGKPELVHSSETKNSYTEVSKGTRTLSRLKQLEHSTPPCGVGKRSNGLLQFNVTHTEGLIGVAIARDISVGIDAESISRRTRSDPLRLARRRFSTAEIEQLETIQEREARNLHFMKIWTLKEAYVKAVGRGISAPPGLSGFSFVLDYDKDSKCCPRCNVVQSAQQDGVTTDAEGFYLRSSTSQSGFASGEYIGGYLLKNEENKYNSEKYSELRYSFDQQVTRIRFEIANSMESINSQHQQEDSRSWYFSLFSPTDNHISALCFQRVQEGEDQGSTSSLLNCSDSPLYKSRKSDGRAGDANQSKLARYDQKSWPNLYLFLCNEKSCRRAFIPPEKWKCSSGPKATEVKLDELMDSQRDSIKTSADIVIAQGYS